MALREHNVLEQLIDIVRLMYRDTTSVVQCAAGTTTPFPIRVGVHQGSALIALVVDSANRHIHKPAPLCLLYTDNVMIANGSRDVQQRKDKLTNIDLKLNVGKTEYLEIGAQTSFTIKIDNTEVPKTSAYRYLGSILQVEEQMKKEVEARIAAMWTKWKMTTGVLRDQRRQKRASMQSGNPSSRTLQQQNVANIDEDGMTLCRS